MYRRLLELRYRFGKTEFFYSLERLCATTGITKAENLKHNLNKLLALDLIQFKTTRGRGKAAEFKIFEPINAPLSEEEVYRLHPRLQSRSYKSSLSKKSYQKNPPEQGVLGKEKILEQEVLGREKIPEQGVLSQENPPEQGANKKDIYKKDNNSKKDHSHDNTLSQNNEKPTQARPGYGAVVALDAEILKKYGIAGEQAAVFRKKYSPGYLMEKIEIIEYKRYQGEPIRNPGGMLRKAIEEDWHLPEGFNTQAQREEISQRQQEAKETEAREAAEKEAKAERQRAMEEAAEAWKNKASDRESLEVHEKARLAVIAENPDTAERWLKPLIRLRENRIPL